MDRSTFYATIASAVALAALVVAFAFVRFLALTYAGDRVTTTVVVQESIAPPKDVI